MCRGLGYYPFGLLKGSVIWSFFFLQVSQTMPFYKENWELGYWEVLLSSSGGSVIRPLLGYLRLFAPRRHNTGLEFVRKVGVGVVGRSVFWSLCFQNIPHDFFHQESFL